MNDYKYEVNGMSLTMAFSNRFIYLVNDSCLYRIIGKIGVEKYCDIFRTRFRTQSMTNDVLLTKSASQK